MKKQLDYVLMFGGKIKLKKSLLGSVHMVNQYILPVIWCFIYRCNSFDYRLSIKNRSGKES